MKAKEAPKDIPLVRGKCVAMQKGNSKASKHIFPFMGILNFEMFINLKQGLNDKTLSKMHFFYTIRKVLKNRHLK